MAAPAICGISSGFGIVCLDLKRVGGLAKRLWLGNITDLRAPFNVDTTDYIQTIELNTYATLYAFDSGKNAYSGNSSLVVGEGGQVSYTQTVLMNLNPTNPTDDAVIDALAVSDVFAVVQTLNNEFLIYGAGNGLRATSIEAPTGKNTGDSTATIVTLTGAERSAAKRFLVGGTVQLTLARLLAQTA